MHRDIVFKRNMETVPTIDYINICTFVHIRMKKKRKMIDLTKRNCSPQ